MDALRRHSVVRESDIFAALFPCAYTPQPTRKPDVLEAGNRTFRIPKLGALSPKTPRALLTTLPMTASDCFVVWKFLGDWVTAQIAMEAPATIPGFGSITMRTQALKVRAPCFDPDRAFLEKYGLRVESVPVLPRTGSSSSVISPRASTNAATSPANDVLAFSYMEMAACCGKHVEAAKAKEWLEILLQKMGEAMRHCDRVDFDLGVGVVACAHRVIEIHMLPRRTNSKSSGEVRGGEGVVQRQLMIPSTPQTARTQTFLAGSNFSPAIRLNAAAPKDDKDSSAVLSLDAPRTYRHRQKQPPRGLVAVVPGSPSASIGASPRTQRLKNQIESDGQELSTNAYPALFDAISRTYCVEHDLNLSFLQPSNRIASNYAPIVAGLVMIKHPQRLGTSRNNESGLAFIEEPLPCDPPYPEEPTRQPSAIKFSGIDDTSAGRGRRAASEQRYFAYLNTSNHHLMDVRWLAPLSQDLVDRIVASAVKYLNESPSGHMKAVLDAARSEFVSNYHVSVKKAIMDYVLMRSATRERLGIPSGTPAYSCLPQRWQWGDYRGVNGCMSDLKTLATISQNRQRRNISGSPARAVSKRTPAGVVESSAVIKRRRRKRAKLKLFSSFMLSDPQLRALQFLWFDFEADLLLVKLPTLCELSESGDPIDLDEFHRTQLSHAAQVRAFVMEHWYNKATQMFEHAAARSMTDPPSSAEFVKMKHLYDALAVQMSLQIRSLIMKSVQAYAAFFELFSRYTGADGEHSPDHPSALGVSMGLHDGTVQLRTPLAQIPSMLLSVLDNMPNLFCNVDRVETQFEAPLESISTGSGCPRFLWNVSAQESEIVDASMRIRQIIEHNLIQLHDLQAEYSKFGAGYQRISSTPDTSEHDSIDEAFSSSKMETWRSELQSVRDLAVSLVRTTRESRHVNLFSVDCKQVNRDLLAEFSSWMHHQLSEFADGTATYNTRLRQQYKDVAARLAKRPLDLYELVEAEQFVSVLKATKLQELQTKVEDVKQRMQFLLFRRESVHIDGPECQVPEDPSSNAPLFTMSNEMLESTAKTIRWRTHIEQLLKDAETTLIGERARIEAVFLAKRNRFQAEIDELETEVKSFSRKGDLRHAASYVVQLSKMKDVLLGFRRQLDFIVEEEIKLHWKPTDFSKLDDVAEEMEPYEQLWKTAREFRELNSRWLRTNIFELQANEGLHAWQQMMTTISTVSNQLQLNAAAAALTAEMMKKQMSDFRENAKIVASILNPSVQDRHLKEMSALLELPIDQAEPITLLKLLENGAFEHLNRVVEISDNATKEKQIEDALQAIAREWNGVQVDFKPEKSGPHTVGGIGETSAELEQRSSDYVPRGLVKASVDEIKLLIEDHQLRLQTLECLPHAVPFAHEISRWAMFLHDLFLVLELMMSNERVWKRIAPLFSANIIGEAEETALFAQADAIHRSVSQRVETQPLCLELVRCGSESSETSPSNECSGGARGDDNAVSHCHQELLSDLQHCRELLERAGNNLSVGFEARRTQFPRFYLLSDGEIVAALATRCTKKSEALASSPQLWRYLRLCFPGVHRVQTSVHRELTSFISAHGEHVPISSPIPTVDIPLATWLAKLETSMATILQACTRAAINDFARKEFRKWCLLWPEQVLLTTIQHVWTMQGELNNRKSSVLEVQEAWRAEVQALADKVKAVSRELKAASNSSARFTLSNVILLLHQLIAVSSQIVQELNEIPSVEVSSPEKESDGSRILSAPPPRLYETTTWLAQPRFYYDASAALGVKLLKFPVIPYGFEYSGNAAPPVYVTPLTLRCFHALALHASVLCRGSHVVGPAAVGKKTSTSALARLSGRLVLQFDCVDALHLPSSDRFHGLAQFLKGAAACGAWLMMTALEHLYRALFLSLLSTTCCQIMDSQAAKLAQCTVLGARTRLKKGVHLIVISSSPAAMKGRDTADLQPLQVAFRPIQLTSHDLVMLTEFFLLEHKIQHSRSLAKLMYAVILVISKQIEILGTSTNGCAAQQQSVLNIRAVRGIVRRVAQRCVHERLAVYSAHGFPPTVSQSSSSIPQKLQLADAEMPTELARDIDKMETNAACKVLRGFAESLLPPQSLESIDFVLRDYASAARTGELLEPKSPILSSRLPEACTPRSVESNILSSTERGGESGVKEDGGVSVQEVTEDRNAPVPTSEIECQKVIHLHDALQNHRVAVVVGDIQSGKTTAWRAVVAMVNQHSADHRRSDPSVIASHDHQDHLSRKTRAVVLHPRAVRLDQLFGSPSCDVPLSPDTVLTHLIRDAKARLGDEDTWLVFDGDISESWADRMLQATEESEEYDSQPRSRLSGLLLPSRGKRTTMPSGMRLVIETTTLKDISPALLAKVGVVHIERPADEDATTVEGSTKPLRTEWRREYRRWKQEHTTAFVVLREELFTVLDVLTNEVMDASLNFVAGEFQDALRLQSVASRALLLHWRIRSFFALLHSLLLQSWTKLASMVSGKQRKIAVHCYFLQALVWGIGHTSDASERQNFHAFLRQWIISGPHSADSSLKRVLVLFFPSSTTGSVASGMSGTQRRLDISGMGGSAANKESLCSFGFSVELGSKWIKWSEFYDTWLADRCQLAADSSTGVGGSKRRQSAGVSVPESSPINDNASFRTVKTQSGETLFVRTPGMAAAVFLMHQLMASGYHTLLCGPRDTGKTTCGRVCLDLHATIVGIQRSNAKHAGSMNSSGSTNADDDAPVGDEHIYSGSTVSASSVLDQLATFIERRRVHQRRHGKDRENADQSHAPSSPIARLSSATLVFFDDLHCTPTGATYDSAMELLRAIVEDNQIVHPTANTPMNCGDRLVPFIALQHDGSRPVGREMHRVVAKFVPIALAPPSDVELTSIFSAFVASQTTEGAPGDAEAGAPDAASLSNTAQEASQLVTTVIKSTIKLFRILSSDQWTSSSAHQFAAASQATKTYASSTAFQPSKAHYLFHLQDIFRVLQHVCGGAKEAVAAADKPLIAKLWCHEAARVFGDRLSDDNDVNLFYNLLQDIVVNQFNFAPDGLLTTTAHGETLVAASNSSSSKNNGQVTWLRDHLYFTFIGESSGAGMFDGYREVHELQKVELSIERSMMGMYRANTTTEALSFVLCTHAIRHILRLTRVLRYSGQHLMLIGRRGSKMHTLTRLAAFICRSKATSFFVPRGQQSDDSAWKAALKSAMLECVRRPRDERSVLIIKDMWLDNMALYAPLDRWFSGSKLLSDMISFDDFDSEILQVLRDEADREDCGDAEPTPAQKSKSTVMHSKSSVVSFFFELVRRGLQFVLIFSLPPESHENQPVTRRLAHLLWQYPHIQKACTINYVADWPEESLHIIAQKCFASAFGTERDRLLQLSEVAVQVYRRTLTAWCVWTRGEKLEEEDKRRPHTGVEGNAPGDRQHVATKTAIPFYDRPCALIQIEPSMLVEHIALFLAHLPRLQQQVAANKLKYAAGLDFMERTEQILALEQSQQQLLQPEMARKTDARRRMSGNLEKEKLTENKVHHALEMETAQVEAQRARLAQVEMEYDALIGEPRDVFAEKTEKMRPFAVAMAEKMESSGLLALESASSRALGNEVASDTAVDDVEEPCDDDAPANEDNADIRPCRKESAANRQRRAMVRTFTAIPQPATSLRQLAECVGLIFGIEPVEVRDELDPDEIVMDYWGTVTQRMESEDFWHEMVDFDVRERITESIVARTLLTCTSPDFDTALFSSIHELAGLLCEWVQACATYARDSLLADPKYAQLSQERLAYDTAIAQMRARQLEVQTQASTTSNANAMRNLSEQERKALEAKLKDNASTLQMATSVRKVLEPCKAKWRALYQHYTEFGAQAMGDLLLATATMVYAGSTTSDIRRRLRVLWSDELHKHFVVHSPIDVPRPMNQVFLVDDKTVTKWHVDGLTVQESACLESAVVAMHSFLFPVVIDPHGVATEWLKRQLTELANRDTAEGESEALAVVSGRTAERQTVWHSITQCVREKKPLVVEDFNETLAVELRSVLLSKHRARFDAVNQDLSSVAGHSSRSPGTGVVGLSRRRSSVGVALSEADEKIHADKSKGVHGYQRCWLEAPVIDQPASVATKTLIECESDSCLVYFLYTEQEAIPLWMATLAPYVSLIRFDFSRAHLRSQCVRTILEAEVGHGQVLTEIQTLQMDTITCDEQIEMIEDEILEFFSAEDPAVVYGDTTKALKIVGNRSALHTLEGSKLESNRKIQHLYLRLAGFARLVERCADIASTWRDLSFGHTQSDSTPFPIEWIWKSLTYAMTHAVSPSTENQLGLFTTTLRQCIRTAFGGSEYPILFELLLSLRVNARRRPSNPSGLGELSGVDDNPQGDEVEQVLARLVQILDCKDEVQVRTLCAGVSSKLLTLRPSDAISVHKWRALCFLAEKASPLRTLMTTQHQSGKDGWKDVLALDQLLAGDATEWMPAVEVDTLARLCFVAVLQRKMLTHEVEGAIARELTWGESCPLDLPESDVQVDDKQAHNDSKAILQCTESHALRPWLGPHSMWDLWKIYSSPTAPILVVSRPETDLIREVSDIATKAKVTVDLTSQEMLTTEAFTSSLLQSIQKGRWVVLPHFDARPEWVTIVSNMLTTIETHDPHSDFRLWVSVSDARKQSILGSTTVTMRLTMANPHHFSDALRHVASILETHFPRCAARDSKALHSAPTTLLVRIAVFHALVSCRELLPHAYWKVRGVEFGDDLVFSLFQAVASMKQQHQEDNESLHDSIRRLTIELYGAGLCSRSAQQVVAYCVELVFGNGATFNAAVVDAASRTMPEVAHVLCIINELETSQPKLELTECIERILVVADSHHGMRDQSIQGTISGLRRVLESRGLLKTASPKLLAAPSTPSRGGNRGHPSQPNSELLQTTTLVMDALSRFLIDMESFDLDETALAEKFPRDYKSPRHQLLHHEVDRLRIIQRDLVHSIQYLQQVVSANEASSPTASTAFSTLMRGETPSSWVALLLGDRNGSSCADVLPLDIFEQTVLERLRLFQSWLDFGAPSRIAIDKFQSSPECVLEVLHQHLVRTKAEHMACDGACHCLRAVRILEDKPQAQLPVREDSVYVSGWRLFGHLQTEIASAQSPTASSPHRKRSSQTTHPKTPQLAVSGIRDEGTPVVLEISAACLATVSTTSPIGSAQGFQCPIHRVWRRDDHHARCCSQRDCSLLIPTDVPVPQVAFSGSHLRLYSLVETNGGASDRL